jgi:integrase
MAGKLTSDAGDSLMSYIAQMDQRLAERSKREYANRVKEISAKIERGDAPLTPDMMIAQLQKLAAEKQIAYSTFRLSKSAIRFWLGQQAQALIASGGDHSDYARAFAALGELRYSALPHEQRTSSKKLKYFPQECLDALVKFADERGHRAPNLVRAAAFVKANLLVGLRPVEWFDACFASHFVRDDKGDIQRDAQGRIKFLPVLIIENAKTTHGRGNGYQRELVLHDITVEEMKALTFFREIAVKFKERHPPNMEPKKLTNLLYRPLNNAIRRALAASGYATQAIPSVYSTRHQVVADFKASGVGKREITAFFGHSSENTHREHYGHKRRGARMVTFRPSEECLARVTDRSITRQPEAIPPQLAADVEMWVAEQESRKVSSTH